MNSDVEVSILISVATVWIAILWMANRLVLEGPAEIIVGWLLISLGVGAIGGFAVSGLISEFNLLILSRSTGASQEAIRAGGYSTFGAGIFGGIFGVLTGVGLGLWFSIRDFKRYLRKESPIGVGGGAPVSRRVDDEVTEEVGLASDNETLSRKPNWIVALFLFGVAVYFLTLGFQTDPLNVFGQECVRAYSTTQRVGGICLRAEWLAVGSVLLVLSLMTAFGRNMAKT